MCPEGCLLEARHSFCPWHGLGVKSLIGQTVAEAYTIERLLSAEGGFGVVYYARNAVSSGQDFEAAIKVLRPNACYDPQAVSDFIDEADRCYHLLNDCRNTAKVLIANKLPFPYIVMSFENGGTLRTKIAAVRDQARPAATDKERRRIRSAELPWRAVYQMLLGIAEALKEAHRKGVVHRDLKPSNILLKRDDDGSEIPKVVDWGISIARRNRRGGAAANAEAASTTTRTLQEGPGRELLRVASQITIKYAPPEVFEYAAETDPTRRNLKTVFDPRTDIYQFGLVAFELLTGEFPFAAPPQDAKTDEREDHWRHQHCRVDGARPFKLAKFRSDLGQRASALHPEIENMTRVVERCLERDPKRRYANGTELFKGLTGEPIWRRVLKYAAAGLVVAAGVYFAISKQALGPPGGVFNKPAWEMQLPDLVAERDERAVTSPQGDSYPLWRIWTRDWAGLKSMETRDREYLSPVLVPNMPGKNGVTNISLLSWRTKDEGVPASITSAGELPPDLQKKVVQAVGAKVQLNLTQLAAFLQTEKDAADERSTASRFLFSLESSFENEATTTDFFEVCLDAQPPVIRDATVTVVSRNSDLPGGAYNIGRTLQKPTAIFLPPESDLLFTYRIDSADEATLEGELGNNPINVESLKLAPSTLQVQRKLSTLLPNLDLNTLAGSVLRLRLKVSDKVATKSGDSPQSTWEWQLQIHGSVKVRVASPLRKERDRVGVASIRLAPALSGNRCAVFWRSRAGGNEPLQEVQSLKAEQDNESGNYDARLQVALDDVDRVLKTAEIEFFGAQRDLLYPGIPEPPDIAGLKALALKYAAGAICTVPPEPEITAADFELMASSTAPANWEEPLARPTETLPFRWLALRPERWPRRLIAKAGKFNPGIDLNATTWILAGPRSKPQPPGSSLELPTKDQGDEVEGTLTVRTMWQQPRQFPFRVSFTPRLEYFTRITLLKPGDTQGQILFESQKPPPSDVTFSEAHAVTIILDLASPEQIKDLTLRLPSVTTEVFASQLVDTRGIFQIKRLGGEPLPEGIHRIQISGTDIFGNQIIPDAELPPLIIQGQQPAVIIANQACGGTIGLPAEAGFASVNLNIKDPSGIKGFRATVKTKRNQTSISVPLDSAAAVDVFLGTQQDYIDKDYSYVRDKTSGLLTEIALKIVGLVTAGEQSSVELTASDVSKDVMERATRCSMIIDAGLDKIPEVVPFLGLDWRWIETGGGKGFYVSKTENPLWFLDQPEKRGNPDLRPQPGSRDWLPKTGMSPRQVVDALVGDLVDLYLPTIQEWGKMIAIDNKVRRPAAELVSVVNCADTTSEAIIDNRDKKTRLLPVTFRVPQDSSELLHTFGNVAEMVENPDSPTDPYLSVGGDFWAKLRYCIQQQFGIEPDEGNDRRGFRLVVYNDADGIPPNVRASRRVNLRFKAAVEAEKKRLAQQTTIPAK